MRAEHLLPSRSLVRHELNQVCEDGQRQRQREGVADDPGTRSRSDAEDPSLFVWGEAAVGWRCRPQGRAAWVQGMAGQALENEQRHAHEPEQAMNRDGRHSPGGRASSKIPLQHAREW